MAESKSFRHDPYPGLPDIPPELLEAYRMQPHDFEEEYGRLKERYPEIAHRLVVGALESSPDALEHKRTFAKGVLFMCGLLSAAAQTEQLRQLFTLENDPTEVGDDGAEDPPLSA